ncbi:hypothetical protein CPC08DRAFT_686233 [Agrocybe pediades]|nr:hypothetical protein CPC08DRAFT_686233 [Agrocybe pediades]
MRQLEKRPAQALASSTYADVVKEASKVRHKRDDDYYFEDGSCVLLVGDTLFNVHRTMLSRDSSSFSTLFSLPQGTRMAEGGSDDNPIVLSGDSPEEFRDFLWALYALPPDLMVANSARANLGQLINVAHISNKYAFKSLEMWALDAIHDFVNRKPSPIFIGFLLPATHLSAPASESGTPPKPPTQAETSHLLTQLIRLAQLCSHDRLMTSMISLLRQLMSSNVRYAYLAMTLSDELNLRALKGQAYMEVMRRGTVVRKVRGEGVCGPGSLGSQRNRSSSSLMHTTSVDDESEESEGGVDASGRLLVTRAQQLRLLAGYYRLTSLWDRLRLPPPSFEHSPSCGATWHQQGCTQAWLEFWKEKTRSDSVMSLGLADVLGRLRLVQKDFERWGSATYMHHDCRAGAKKAIVEIIAKVEESLPDYFVEPGEFEED